MSDTIKLPSQFEIWADVKPGEAGELQSGDLVLKIDPECDLAGWLPDSHGVGVVIRTDCDGGLRPGQLYWLDDETEVTVVVWHGARVPY